MSLDPALEPALQVKDISFRLNHTRDLNVRNELLVRYSIASMTCQVACYGTGTSNECVVYANARRKRTALPKECENYDCNGLRNPCPKVY